MTWPALLPRRLANWLNAASGRIYSRGRVTHSRAKRQADVWLSPFGAMRPDDFCNADAARRFHEHSIDAAQEGFDKACQTAQANRPQGAHYPHRCKFYWTTICKASGIRVKEGQMRLSLARPGADHTPGAESAGGVEDGQPAYEPGRSASGLVSGSAVGVRPSGPPARVASDG